MVYVKVQSGDGFKTIKKNVNAMKLNKTPKILIHKKINRVRYSRKHSREIKYYLY